jgi:recombination protein RecT
VSAPLADKLNEADARQQAGLETTPKNRDLFGLLTDMEPALRRAFPKTVDVGRFIRLAQTTLRTVPRLLECTPESVMAGFMQAAQLGVEIDAVRGQAYLIPRKNGRTNKMEANFQLGYHGLIDIAGRSGVTVRVRAVRDADEFIYEDGIEPVLRHVPFLKGDRGDAYAYFTVASFADERPSEFLVMTRAEVEVVRDRFGHRNPKTRQVDGPWVTDFDAMAYKTLIIRQLNYMPLPVEVLDAIHDDEMPVNVENTLDRPPELPPPAPDSSPPGDASEPAAEQAEQGSDTGPAPARVADLVDKLDQAVTDAKGAATEPAADPIAQEHIDAMSTATASAPAAAPVPDETVRQKAARLVVSMPDNRYEGWAAYQRRTGISSTPERWTTAQARDVIAWIETPPAKEE